MLYVYKATVRRIRGLLLRFVSQLLLSSLFCQRQPPLRSPLQAVYKYFVGLYFGSHYIREKQHIGHV